MTPGDYYRRERDRQLLRMGVLGPVWKPGSDGSVWIPPASVLAELTLEPVDPDGEAWLRRRLAELADRANAMSPEDDPT